MQRVVPDDWRRVGARALDVVLAVGLATLGAVDGLRSDEFPRTGVDVAVLMGLAGAVLLLRRTRPLVTLTVAMGAMGLVALLYGTYQSGTSVLIAVVAVYSATAYGDDVAYVIAVCFAFDIALAVNAPLAGVLPTVLFTTGLLVVVAAAGIGARTLRARARRAGEEIEELEERAAEAAARAATAERTRIARELHDILAHGLGVVVLQCGAAEHSLDSNPDRARVALDAARRTAEQAIEQLRTLVTVARDSPEREAAPQPTVEDLRRLARESSTPRFEVGCTVDPDASRLPPQIQASVYRIAQEGVANSLKHSGAAGCEIVVLVRDGRVRVQVVDDGPGAETPAAGSRLGLSGIRERVSVYGGRMDAGAQPGGGWRMAAEIPVPV